MDRRHSSLDQINAGACIQVDELSIPRNTRPSVARTRGKCRDSQKNPKGQGVR